MLAMGDALAVALHDKKGFKAEDFAFFHPGGNIGKRLLLTVRDIMRTGKNLPVVPEKMKIKECNHSENIIENSPPGTALHSTRMPNSPSVSTPTIPFCSFHNFCKSFNVIENSIFLFLALSLAYFNKVLNLPSRVIFL